MKLLNKNLGCLVSGSAPDAYQCAQKESFCQQTPNTSQEPTLQEEFRHLVFNPRRVLTVGVVLGVHKASCFEGFCFLQPASLPYCMSCKLASWM
eukprot:3246671-Amphidinium_carterae.1